MTVRIWGQLVEDLAEKLTAAAPVLLLKKQRKTGPVQNSFVSSRMLSVSEVRYTAV